MQDMSNPLVSEVPSSIFSDAINISSGHFYSNHFDDPSTSQYNSESSQELGMLVGGGIVLSPNEAQMFKKIQKIVAENKSLKNALVVNSIRLQDHVNDCIHWKENHKNIEESLKDKLMREENTSKQLQNRLDFLNTAITASSNENTTQSTTTKPSSHSSMRFLVDELNRQSNGLTEAFQTTIEDPRSPENVIIAQGYQGSINMISEFVTTKKFDNLNHSLSDVMNLCLPLVSPDGKLLLNTVTSIQDAIKDYQTTVMSLQNSHQIPLIQHIELKQQLEVILADNQQIKSKMNNYIEQCREKEDLNVQLKKEIDEIKLNIFEKNTFIEKLTLKVQELENCRSVEILDMTPQQQPKEIKQLEANIESYKKTIHTLKERNETLNNDLMETTDSFEKIEEENGDLRQTNEELTNEVERLNDVLSSNSDHTFLPDIDISADEQRTVLQKYSLKVIEQQTIIKSLNEELEKLRHKQLVTYELSDNGGGNEDKLLEELNINQEALSNTNKRLLLTEKEYVAVTKQLRSLEIVVSNKKDEELSTEKLVNKLKLKEEEVEKMNKSLDEKQSQCDCFESDLKEIADDYEMKNRVKRNREAKDADRINDLIKKNEDTMKEMKSVTIENTRLRQRIENFQAAVVQDQNPSGKSKDETSKCVERLLVEKTQLIEELKKLNKYISRSVEENNKNSTNLHQMKKENDRLKEQIAEFESKDRNSTEQSKAESTESVTEQKFVNLQKEYQLLQENLQEESELNSELFEAKKQLEEKLSTEKSGGSKNECQLLQADLQSEAEKNKVLVEVKKQLVEEVSSQRKNLNEMRDQLTAAQKASEKQKRDNQLAFNNLQIRTKYNRELEEKINEVTTELVGAKELIGELQETERKTTDESGHMKEQVEEMAVLRMQLDVYINDFNAERDSREKQHTTLMEVQSRVEQLQLENHCLKEELQKKGGQGLNSIRQRHGNQSYSGSQQSIDSRNSHEQSMDQRRADGNAPQNYNTYVQRDHEGQWQKQRQQQQQQRPHNSNWQVFGKGNEQNEQRRGSQQRVNNRMDEDDQRKCPKCQEVLPDLDSLQIHVMECLDK